MEGSAVYSVGEVLGPDFPGDQWSAPTPQILQTKVEALIPRDPLFSVPCLRTVVSVSPLPLLWRASFSPHPFVSPSLSFSFSLPLRRRRSPRPERPFYRVVICVCTPVKSIHGWNVRAASCERPILGRSSTPQCCGLGSFCLAAAPLVRAPLVCSKDS